MNAKQIALEISKLPQKKRIKALQQYEYPFRADIEAYLSNIYRAQQLRQARKNGIANKTMLKV